MRRQTNDCGGVGEDFGRNIFVVVDSKGSV